MYLFIHQVSIRLKESDKKQRRKKFDLVINAHQNQVHEEYFQGHVCIEQASDLLISMLLQAIIQERFKKLKSITFCVKNPQTTAQYITRNFTILEAAGGVVSAKEGILLIYRLHKWDLPKGKIEPNENPKIAAIREIEEECGIKAFIAQKITTTWHYYQQDQVPILKKTYWYLMHPIAEGQTLVPQKEENIQQAIWMKPEEVRTALKNSYLSIAHVIRKYLKGLKV
ncbi:MAG: NUDIX hydrolase [Cytophagales bacterium]|nr:MAG: NUDIX hydrolase [Cytophagales bacterium]